MTLKNPVRFMRSFASVYHSHLRNPKVSGSVPSDARLVAAAGSDERHKNRLSGPATVFGEPGRSTKVKR